MTLLIGQAALNISIILYLVHFLPQLVHNMRLERLRAVNLHFHGLLSLSYLADLSYGFGMGLPWQYKLISLAGTLNLMIQQFQLRKVHKPRRIFRFYSLLIFGGFLVFCLSLKHLLSQNWYLLAGYVTQITALIYLLPAIYQNWRTQTAGGLSPHYLSLNGLCYTCSVLAAFCLNWPLPSKLGASFGLFCLIVCLVQYQRYRASVCQSFADCATADTLIPNPSPSREKGADCAN